MKDQKKDSERLKKIGEMLMQADVSVSDKLGLRRGWVDIRKAIDEVDLALVNRYRAK